MSSTSPRPTSFGGDLAVEQPRLGPRGSPWSRRAGRAARRPRRRAARSLSTKSAWSRWAFSTHITSSKSRSSALVGVSRRCARPGAQTSTLRSRADLGVDAVASSWRGACHGGSRDAFRSAGVRSGTFRWSIQPAARATTPTTAPATETAQDHELARGEQPPALLAPGHHEEDRGRGVDDEGDQDELRPGREQQERRVERRPAPRPISSCGARRAWSTLVGCPARA